MSKVKQTNALEFECTSLIKSKTPSLLFYLRLWLFHLFVCPFMIYLRSASPNARLHNFWTLNISSMKFLRYFCTLFAILSPLRLLFTVFYLHKLSVYLIFTCFPVAFYCDILGLKQLFDIIDFFIKITWRWFTIGQFIYDQNQSIFENVIFSQSLFKNL